MFIRRNKNRSGSVSIQIIQKIGRRNKIIKTLGSALNQREEDLLVLIARNEIERLGGIESIFVEHDDIVIDSFVKTIGNEQIKIVGPQLVFGKIYDKIGYDQINEKDYFKNLVICRLVYPGSKLKTV